MTATEYVTPAEAAGLLNVSPTAVTRWVREGYIKSWRSPGVKGRIRIPRSEIDRLLAGQPEAAS